MYTQLLKECKETSIQEDTSAEDQIRDVLQSNLQRLLDKGFSKKNKALDELATNANNNIDRIIEALSLLKHLESQTEKVIHALIVLPLEVDRLERSSEFEQEKIHSYEQFYDYHIRDRRGETKRLLLDKSSTKEELEGRIDELKKLQLSSGSRLSERQSSQLRPLLQFTRNLLKEVDTVRKLLASNDNSA